MKDIRLILGLLFIAAIITGFAVLHQRDYMFSFESLREARMVIDKAIMDEPIRGAFLYGLVYVAVISLSLPLATPLTVIAGFLFGTFWGTLLVAISATIGATIIFSLARFFFRDFFQKSFRKQFEIIDKELTSNGFRDILFLRLTPLIPFAAINVGTALTKVRLKDYVLATLIGTLPFTFVYVQAGTRLSEVETLSDILSFRTLVAISLVVVVAFIPIALRKRKSDQQESSQNEESIDQRSSG